MTTLEKLSDFSKIIKDFINDLMNTFPDKVESIITNKKYPDESVNDLYILYNYTFDLSSSGITEDLYYEEQNDIASTIINIENEDLKNYFTAGYNVLHYCKSVYPERFFDILYQNCDIFTDVSKNTFFLPHIDIGDVFFDTTSDTTKEAIWKYIQVILFNIVGQLDDKDSFGESAKLFEAINNDEFKEKLTSTFQEIEKMFTKENFMNMNTDISGRDQNDNQTDDDIDINNMMKNMFSHFGKQDNSGNDNLPNPDDIHEHINNLVNGKLGSLAKELAEETAKDLNIDENNVKDVNDVFKQLFKDPSKLMKMVENIGTKIDGKMKDGSIKESELLEEASELFKNMKSMPGMGNMESILKSMNLNNLVPPGGKINHNAMQNMMDTNIKMSKTRERMRKKLDENNKNKLQNNIQTLHEQVNNLQNNMQYSENYVENKGNEKQDLQELNNNLQNLMAQLEMTNKNIDKQNNNNNIERESSSQTKRRKKKKNKPIINNN